jgi:hypothetical protein
MSAARLADVLVGDPHPAVSLGLRDHPLEDLAFALLDVGAGVKLPPDLRQPAGQGVPHPLQILDVKNAGPSHGPDGEVDALAGEGRAEQRHQLPLHERDLAPEVLTNPPWRDLAQTNCRPRWWWAPRADVRSRERQALRDRRVLL